LAYKLQSYIDVPFNIPPVTGQEAHYIARAISSGRLTGDGQFTQKCHHWFRDNLGCPAALLTTSCTHALEISALLADIRVGDEVIMPSYTFVSTANAFALRGAKIVFVDIRPDTMNINEELIEAAITGRTKAIVPVHYAGVACEMDIIMKLADRYGLMVIEDAAQGVMSSYKGKALGTIGHLGCFSFHDTKNYTCGEGGALVINDESFVQRAEIIREKGTDRSRFLRGETDRYTWVDIGSSYLPSELNAAFLFAQLEAAEDIRSDRMRSWELYYTELEPLAERGLIGLPHIPSECAQNGHAFYIKTADCAERTRLIKFFKGRGIAATFHYIPLHNSQAGQEHGQFHGPDRYTTVESERILRLPLYYRLENEKVAYVINSLRAFYNC